MQKYASDTCRLPQEDFYPLFAYRRRYLSGAGEPLRIYFTTSTCSAPLPIFAFSAALRLSVVPCDLETGQLIESGILLRESLVASD